MAPFTHEHCPVCAAETTQHFILVDALQPHGLETICEGCQTVLIYGDDGLVGQRAATEEERAAMPRRPKWTAEQWAEYREDMRQGMADVQAWIGKGCPGLTREMLEASPHIAAALTQLGARLPDEPDAKR